MRQLKQILLETGTGLNIHDFRVIHQGKTLQFDVVVPEKFQFVDTELERILRSQIEEKSEITNWKLRLITIIFYIK